jgi:hypothetical protein
LEYIIGHMGVDKIYILCINLARKSVKIALKRGIVWYRDHGNRTIEMNTHFDVIETGSLPLLADLPATQGEERLRERKPISNVIDVGIQRRQNTICS